MRHGASEVAITDNNIKGRHFIGEVFSESVCYKPYTSLKLENFT